MGILGNAFSGWHLLLVLAVVVLLFGASRLPGLARGLGESVRILRTESRVPTPSEEGDRAPTARHESPS